jgi:hypothetical protein
MKPGQTCYKNVIKSSGCFLPPFSPTLLHCLADPLTRRCRKVSFPPIRGLACWTTTLALTALQGCNGSVKTVPFGFQLRDD